MAEMFFCGKGLCDYIGSTDETYDKGERMHKDTYSAVFVALAFCLMTLSWFVNTVNAKPTAEFASGNAPVMAMETKPITKSPITVLVKAKNSNMGTTQNGASALNNPIQLAPGVTQFIPVSKTNTAISELVTPEAVGELIPAAGGNSSGGIASEDMMCGGSACEGYYGYNGYGQDEFSGMGMQGMGGGFGG